VINDLHLDFYQTCDELLLNYLKNKQPASQIIKDLAFNPKKQFFPYITILKTLDFNKSSKLIHPLMPKSTAWLKEQRIPYTYYPFLLKKNRQMLNQGAVILDSSILGL
jgi:hypothetical protein